MLRKLLKFFSYGILLLCLALWSIAGIAAAVNKHEIAYGPTKPDEHLWRIARQINPGNGLTTHQVMVALLHANPGAFSANNVNQLKTGYVLHLPAADVIAKVSPADATQEILAQDGHAPHVSTKTASATGNYINVSEKKQNTSERQTENTENNVAPYGADDLAADANAVTAANNKNVAFSSRDFVYLGPLSIAGQYSDNYGYTMRGAFATGLGTHNAIALLVEYGADQARLNGTIGYAITDVHRIKVTAERLWQNMDFAFDSGTVNERVAQDAVGMTYEYLLGKGFWHDVNLNGAYSSADSKNLGTVIFDNNGVLSENYRNIAGGEDKSVSFGVDVQPWQTGLLGVQLNYDDLTYDKIYDTTDSNSSGFGATVNLQQLLTDHVKLDLSASHRSIYDNYSAEISWLVPVILRNSVTLGIVGSRTSGGDDLPDDNRIALNLALQLDHTDGQREHKLNLTGIDDSIADWTALPAVYMQQVLAVVDQMTKEVSNPQVSVPDKLYVVGQTVRDDITSGITIGSSVLQSVSAPDLEKYGLKVNLGSDGKTVTIDGIPNQVVPLVSILLTIVNNAGKTADTSFNLTINNATNAPIIQSLSVMQGVALGGFKVEIVGLNFVTGTSAAGPSAKALPQVPYSLVTFGGNLATNIVVKDDRHIEMTAPAHPPGTVDVVVINPDGQTGAKFQGFTYTTSSPVVQSLLDNRGSAEGGTYILVEGDNFVHGATVSFGGVLATDVSVLDFQHITLRTPLHAPGSVDVTVKNVDATSGTLINGFTYNAKPVVTSVAPISGSVVGGEGLDVYGANFSNHVLVTFGGMPATQIVVSDSGHITCKTPAHAAGKVDVTVINSDAQSGTLPSAYEYLNAPIGITGIAPTSGTTGGGTQVTIHGQNFIAGATVTFGGNSATIVNVAASQITCLTPAHNAGAVDVVVTNPDTKTATSHGGFTFLAAPQITADLNPESGPVLGGTHVQITGANFAIGATVQFDGIVASNIQVVNANAITCNTPAHAAGVVDVKVTNSDNQSVIKTGGFTFVAAPVVNKISPTEGSEVGGTHVMVTGENFIAGAKAKFDNTVGDCIWHNATFLECIAPAHAIGTVDLTIINPDNQISTPANAFIYTKDVTISRIMPNFGPTVGGTAVTIYGTNLAGGGGAATTVTFDGIAATNVVATANSITCNTPAHTAAGDVNVVVNVDGQPFDGGIFTYQVEPVPTPIVHAITPNSGSTLNNTTPVVIYGVNFASNLTVTFGGIAAINVEVIDSGYISCAAPKRAAAGAVDVVVQNNGGAPSLPITFTYIAPPSDIVLTPVHGPASGGTSVTVSGTNIDSDATVTFGGIQASCSSSGPLTCTTPAHAGGDVTVVVTNHDGQTANAPFTYDFPPSITLISPEIGQANAEQMGVKIYGLHFASGAIVKFGNLSATITSSALGQIICIAPAQDVGAVDVTVTNPDNQSAVAENAYTYKPISTLSSVSPTEGYISGGNSVTLKGSNFWGTPVIEFGTNLSLATDVQVVDANTITCTAPAHALGLVNITLINTDNQKSVLNDAYTYIYPAPLVTNISPNYGSKSGGTQVVFTGNYFTANTIAYFGEQPPVNCVYQGAQQVTCTTPWHSVGVVDVELKTVNGSWVGDNAYAYIDSPQLTSISPYAGTRNGGTPVTLTGQNFATAATVLFGDKPATGVVVSDSATIKCNTPASLPGIVNVTVKNPVDPVTSTLTNAYTYVGM